MTLLRAPVVLLVVTTSCAASTPTGAPDAGADARRTVPLAGLLEPGVWRELVTIDAPAPPANPVDGAKTPTAFNKARFLRYRSAQAARDVRAIFVGMPGMPAGAMAYDQLARRLVKLAQGAVEFWSIDRRANLLEDLTGMQAAEAARDPDLAWRYYDERIVIEGRRYAGPPTKLSYMSEWGLAMTLADLRAVIARVPAGNRKPNVILVGHSFGAAVVQAYAAWDHAGEPGAASIAGLVLLDGGVHLYRAPSAADYRTKGAATAAGLDDLRAGRSAFLPYFGFGAEAFMTVEVTAMRAWLTPEARVRDPHVDRFATALFLKKPPPLTAAAAVGFTLDDASSPVRGSRASCGAPRGPVETYTSPLTKESLVRPSRADLLYGWRDYDEVTPREKTSVAVLARVAHEGPTNRIEWYMPARLALDTAAVSALSVKTSDWQYGFGLRATRNREMDAPVLVVLAGRGIVPKVDVFASYRAAIAPSVGAGRPRVGATRANNGDISKAGFGVLDLKRHAHDDLVHGTGADADREIYRPLLDWALSNVRGMVRVP